MVGGFWQEHRQFSDGFSMVVRNFVPFHPSLHRGVIFMPEQSGHWPDTASRFDDVCVCHTEDVRLERTFVNVENVRTLCDVYAMSDPEQTGYILRKLYDKSGLSLGQIAKRAGYKGRSSVQKYFSEDYDKYLTPNIANKLATAFEGTSVNPSEVLELAEKTSVVDQPLSERNDLVTVIGEVKAGAWLEESQWSEEQQYQIAVGPNPIPGTKRFAVKMVGNSMDRQIPPGSELECAYVRYGGVIPISGDLVIVERPNHDLTEMTCKRLSNEGGRWLLKCESYQEEFQYSLDVGSANEDLHIDNEVSIIGVVLNFQKNVFRRS